MKTYSLNDMVYFKLTESGHEILRKNAEQFHRDYPKTDIQYRPDPFRDDWYRNQLHWILSEFGGRCMAGQLLPISDLTFEDPFEARP